MKKAKHNFYLNSYDFYKWTRCITCDSSTKVRKYCLMIHYKDDTKDFKQLFSLNKSCKFCPKCDLIIGQKSELDALLEQMLSGPPFNKKFNPNDYLVFGTIKRADWAENQKNPSNPIKILDLTNPFIEIQDFQIQPAGWYKD